MDGRLRRAVPVAAVVLLGWIGLAAAQQQPPAGGGDGGGRPQWNPEQFRQRMMERMKEQLGASDAEWKVLEPRIEKVQTLSRQAMGGGRMMMGGRGGFGGPGGRGGDNARGGNERPAPEMTPIEKAASDLRAALEKKDVKSAEIAPKLAAYRAAKQKARKDLADAQASLKELLTAKQEAQLVMMGMLE